ncbi:MAG: hypothetical protein LBL31_03225, partial [Spirochaetaceae bacterium]|nr:hypothetical protein [Spirochaetaceae bacterium]
FATACGGFRGKPRGIKPFVSSLAQSCPCKHGRDFAPFVNKITREGMSWDCAVTVSPGSSQVRAIDPVASLLDLTATSKKFYQLFTGCSKTRLARTLFAMEQPQL